jgi:hypothetical protein
LLLNEFLIEGGGGNSKLKMDKDGDIANDFLIFS